MITINGRTGFFKKKIILRLNKYDNLSLREEKTSICNAVMLNLNDQGGWRLSRVHPNDPPFVVKRRILGVTLEVISNFSNDYVHVSPGR